MIELFRAARQLQDFCDSRGWLSCFIGGIAVQRWGEPRVTRDLDLTLFAGFGQEDGFIEALRCRDQQRAVAACKTGGIVDARCLLRPLDIRDAEGVVLRNRLDWRHIEEQIGPRAEAKGDRAMLETIARLRRMGGAGVGGGMNFGNILKNDFTSPGAIAA